MAFQAWRGNKGAPDPEVTFGERAVEIEAGDVLEYEFYTPTEPAGQAGVDILFEDGSRLIPPTRSQARTGAQAGAWVHRTIPLDAFAGSRSASFQLVARGAPGGPCSFYVADVEIRRASSEPVVLFDATMEIPWQESISNTSHAACFTVDQAAHYPRSFVPAGGERPGEPWALMDLTVFRRRVAASSASGRALPSRESSSVASGAVEASAHAIDEDPDLAGVVYLGAGVPFRFAGRGEAPAIPAEGQRLGLENLDGGRFYELYLAIAVEGGVAIDTTWQILGRRGSARPLSIHIDPRTQAPAGADIVTLAVPIAADFEIESFRMPEDPRLLLYAASLRWRKDGPVDLDFRRRWMAREVGSARLERYYREVEIGSVFATLTGTAVLEGEARHERELFNLALRGDSAGFEHLLTKRLEAFHDEGAKIKANHITFVGVTASNADASRSSTEATSVHDLERAIAAGRAAPELCWAGPSMQTAAGLRDRDPQSFEELRGSSARGRVDLVRGAWAGDGTGGGAEAMARELLFGRQFAERYLSVSSAVPSSGAPATPTTEPVDASVAVGLLPRDLGYARQLPQLCRAAGVRALVGADDTEGDRPAAFSWSSPDGSRVRSAAWSKLPEHGPNAGFSERDLVDRLRRASRDGAPADILVGFEVDVDSAAGRAELRRNLDDIDRLSVAELAPTVSIHTPSSWLESLHDDSDDPLPVWDGARQASGPSHALATPRRVRAANRRAEAALVRAERYAALARADGLVYVREYFEELWRSLLRAEAFEHGDPAATAAVEADAQRIFARAQELSRGALAVLVRSANTLGPGRPIAVYNPLPWDRIEPIEIAEGDASVLDSDLRPVESQRTASGTRVFMASLPSLGRVMFHLVPGAGRAPEASVAPAAPAAPIADEWTIENGKLRLTLDPATGRVQSLRLMPKGEELLARNGIGGNVTVLYPARGAGSELGAPETASPASPASPGLAALGLAALGPAALEIPEIIDQLDSIRVLERGPVRSLVRIERTIHGAHLVQDLALYAHASELSIHTRIEGGADLGRLCSQFELKRASPWVVHGVPFGSATLPCEKRDVAAEIQALDWISQSTSKLSITLCNDAGASFGAGGRIVSMTLDDPDSGADPKAREIACTLHVDREGWRAGAPHTAAELEHPPQVVRAEAHDGVRSARHSFLRMARVQPDGRAVEGPRSGLLLSAFKVSEEGDEWVLRVFESKGQAGTVRFTFDRPIFAAQATDLLERPTAEKRAPEPRISGTQVDLPIAPYRIETLRVSFRKR